MDAIQEEMCCHYGSDTTTSITLHEKGNYQVCITRTSGPGEHVEGTISLSGSAGFRKKFRSDKGGMTIDFAIADDGKHELSVAGSAHSWTSALTGCKDSKIAIIVQHMEGVDAVSDEGIPTYVQIKPGDMLDHRKIPTRGEKRHN